jgi:broad specificity phosphatase PhoE
VYLVRHGETLFNRAWRHQFPEVALSEKGKEQAILTANRFQGKKIDVILSSDLVRAKETAGIVADLKGMPYEEHDLFREIRRPTELIGMPYYHPKSVWAMGLVYLMSESPQWHYSDEENVSDFQARARASLHYLADRSERSILLVTHRGLIAGMLAALEYESRDTIAQFLKGLRHTLMIANCSVTTLTYDPAREPQGDHWSVETLNDTSHLIKR